MPSDGARLLCFGDNHGNAPCFRRILDDVRGDEFDAIVHTGDLTNTYFDGAEQGHVQLNDIRPHLERLNEMAPLVYVLGNRDTGIEPDDIAVGTHIPTDDIVEVGDLRFTQSPSIATGRDDTIWVSHYWRPIPFEFDGLGYLSGDTHNGVHYRNVVNTDFLYRTDNHGADAIYGGYFVVDATPTRDWSVSYRSLGPRELRTCPRHGVIGSRVMFDTMHKSCWACHNRDESQVFQTLVRWFEGVEHWKGRDYDQPQSMPQEDTLSSVVAGFEGTHSRKEIVEITAMMPATAPDDWITRIAEGGILGAPDQFEPCMHADPIDDDQSSLADF